METDMTLARPKPRSEDFGEPGRATYEGDLYAWALEQAALVRAERIAEVDRENVAEELEALARSQFDKFVSFLQLVILHILKWDHQPERRTRSWWLSIALHRDHARAVLGQNPSFKSRIEEATEIAYRRARLEASRQTKLPLSAFPEACPYSFAQIFDRVFPSD
jgi:hypothetical protein